MMKVYMKEIETGRTVVFDDVIDYELQMGCLLVLRMPNGVKATFYIGKWQMQVDMPAAA